MKFTYLRPWPNQISAEAEFAPRLQMAAERVGIECKIATQQEINEIPVNQRKEIFGDFVLLPHFTLPPVEGLTSISLLWNSPTTVNKYRHGTVNISLAQFYLSGGSNPTDAFFLDAGNGAILGNLFPSAIELNLTPNANQNSKLFYSGINWERITGEKARHAELLEILDSCDLVDIYGPSQLQGRKVWQGYKNYKGELKGDGEQVVKVANSYGVSLGLLNAEHVAWGLAPMRISESFAAKNILISEQHPILESFQDVVHIIPNEFNLEQKARFIGEKLSFIKRNPELSREIAEEASKRWFMKHSLEFQLKELVKKLAQSSASETTAYEYLINPSLTSPILDAHDSAKYLLTLRNYLESSSDRLIFHTSVSEENKVKIEKYFSDNPGTCYILGFVDLGDIGYFEPHSSLENIDHQNGSWFSAEALVLNLDALKLSYNKLLEIGETRFFEKLLLGDFGVGEVLPINFGKLKKTWRFNLPLRVANNVHLLTPGKVSDIYWTGFPSVSNSVNVLTVISNSLPAIVKAFLRRVIYRK